MLLPPDLRDWVPSDHLAHFIIDAVEALDLRQVSVNTRGTGDARKKCPRARQGWPVIRRTHARRITPKRGF